MILEWRESSWKMRVHALCTVISSQRLEKNINGDRTNSSDRTLVYSNSEALLPLRDISVLHASLQGIKVFFFYVPYKMRT